MSGYDRSLYTTYLQQVPMLRSCSPEELEHIAQLGVALRAPEGTRLVRQGEPGDQFFVILDGTVEVSRDGQSVAKLGRGDYFGELALFDPARRNATVIAISPTTVVSVSRNTFWELLDELSSLRDALLTGMATRLHELEGRA